MGNISTDNKRKKMLFIKSFFLVAIVLSILQVIFGEEESTSSCAGNWYEIPQHGCFLFKLDVRKQWLEAQEFCEEHGGYLPEITDAYLQQSLIAFTQLIQNGTVYAWTGGNDNGKEGQWRWLRSGKKIEETFWYGICPRDSYSYNCLSLENFHDYSESWVDSPCTSRYSVICQKEI